VYLYISYVEETRESNRNREREKKRGSERKENSPSIFLFLPLPAPIKIPRYLTTLALQPNSPYFASPQQQKNRSFSFPL
jgi:hypothetical protein